MSKKDKRIAELEDEVARLRAELTLANARAATPVVVPCIRPHTDDAGPWISPGNPGIPFWPPPLKVWC